VFGRTDAFIWAVLLICIVCAVTDVARGKIYNWMTLPALGAGVFFAIWQAGISGFFGACLGVLAGLVSYGWMFGLGVMGGGDVKMLMALGAWGGFRFTFEVALLGVLVGGFFAVFHLIFRGKFFGFAFRLSHFFLTLVAKGVEPELPQIDGNLTMPYGVPIAVSAVWIIFGDPLARVGWGLW